MVSKSKGDMTVAKWKDKRDVLMICNAHIPKVTTVTNRRGNEKQKPNIVKDYNNSMSGIDRSDQMLFYHSGLRKTLKWYKKARVHILEMFLTNDFYIYRKFSTNRDLSHLVDFKENVIKCLIGERKKKTFMESEADFPYLAPISEGEKKKNRTRRCKQCWKNKSRKESRYVCGYCEDHPALCIHPCFHLYHQDIGIAKYQEEVTIEVVEEVSNFDCRLDLIRNENKQQNNYSYLFSSCKFTSSFQKSMLSPELNQMCSDSKFW